MLILQERDIKLFEFLTSGATPLATIASYMQKEFDIDGLRQRLHLLKKNEYINSSLYPDHKRGNSYALYVLTKNAAQVIIEMNNEKYKLERIRTYLPAVHTVAHELVIVDIVRRIKKESESIKYDLTFADESLLKRSKNWKWLYPDLYVQLRFYLHPGVDLKTFLIEVDMGSRLKLEVVNKVEKSPFINLILCSTRQRMDDLRSAFMVPSRDNLLRKVFFALICDFCTWNGALIGTDWTTADLKKAVIRPRSTVRSSRL